MEEKKYLKWYNKIGYGSGDIAVLTQMRKHACCRTNPSVDTRADTEGNHT